MAIAFDAASQNGVNASSITVPHTCTGSNLILFMGVTFAAGTSLSGTPTYNGVNMTQLGSVEAVGGSVFSNTYFFYLIAPATGTHNIVVNSSSTNYIYVAAASYTGVDQSSPIDASVYQNHAASSTSITGSITTTVDNDWLVSYSVSATANSLNAGTNTTQRASAGPNWCAIGDTNAAQTPTGSYGQTWTGSSDNRGIFVAAFKPVSAGGATVLPRKALLGVGK